MIIYNIIVKCEEERKSDTGRGETRVKREKGEVGGGREDKRREEEEVEGDMEEMLRGVIPCSIVKVLPSTTYMILACFS